MLVSYMSYEVSAASFVTTLGRPGGRKGCSSTTPPTCMIEIGMPIGIREPWSRSMFSLSQSERRIIRRLVVGRCMRRVFGFFSRIRLVFRCVIHEVDVVLVSICVDFHCRQLGLRRRFQEGHCTRLGRRLDSHLWCKVLNELSLALESIDTLRRACLRARTAVPCISAYSIISMKRACLCGGSGSPLP